MAAAQLDDAIQIVTPENIAFQYRVAGPFVRLPAYLIDFGIRIVLFLVSAWIIGVVARALDTAVGWGVLLVLVFVATWFYGGLFETFWNGQTPGKRIMGIRVLSVDGRPINALQAVLRNVLRTVDAQPALLSLIGLVAAASNPRYQRLGDIVCGTLVVVEQRQWWYGLVRTTDPEVLRVAGQLPAGLEMTQSLARTLAAYVRRREGLSAARRQEIARLLAPLLRQRWSLPAEVGDDLLLRAVYHRAFLRQTEAGAKRPAPAAQQANVERPTGGNPFSRQAAGDRPGATQPA